ncbi:hypothetical protein CGZ92_03530 [Parenemella sanctibonifatiensis]|uniref:Uncharacterized protein n=1 Tax=Parenemella sanctibonifatiensis TaxID=2016505 RepID=A0A255EB41_9ACTN|nr:hypothetical protein CGZ92_03530 [Parenemella sanctibonifatiensis]
MVAVAEAAGLAMQIAREYAVPRVVLFDPRPSALSFEDIPGSVMADVGELFSRPEAVAFFEKAAEAEQSRASEGTRADLYLDQLEEIILPGIADPHQRRAMLSGLAVMRRDGFGDPGESPAPSPVPAWHDATVSASVTVVLTVRAKAAVPTADAARAKGFEDARLRPRPQAWWWTEPWSLVEEIIQS